MKLAVSFCLAAALAMSGCTAGSAAWSSAVTQSKVEKKPILLNFGGPW